MPTLSSAASTDEQRALNELRNTVVNLLQGLVDQGVISREKAAQMVRDAQNKAAAEAAATAARDKEEEGAVRVPYVPQIVKDELRKQVAADLSQEVTKNVVEQAKAESWGVPAALPEWLQHTRWSGDFRLRGEADLFSANNAPYLNYQAINQAGGIGAAGFGALLDTTQNVERLRVRLRLGMTSDLGSGWSVTGRLATGDLVNPGSTNQTLGSYFDRYQVTLDQAYLQWTGRTASDRQSLTVDGGRMPNPWLSTNMLWADDLNFDGVSANYHLGLSSASPKDRFLFLTGGAFAVQQVVFGDSKMLYAGQLGLDWTTDGGSRLRVAAAYYQYQNITGQLNPFGSTVNNYTAPPYLQLGNTLFDIYNGTNPNSNLFALAAQYHLADVTARYDWRIGSHRLSFTGDAVKNVGYKASEVDALTGQSIKPRTGGAQAEVAFGSADMAMSSAWRASLGYRYLQRDAVLDAFNDQDLRLGGTDIKGFFIGGEYALGPHLNTRLRYLSGSQIDGAPLSIDVLMLDLNASF
jgi:hypothetical protein